MSFITVSGLGQFSKADQLRAYDAYLIKADQIEVLTLPTEASQSEGFQIPGTCQAIWIKPGLEATPRSVTFEGGFTLQFTIKSKSQSCSPGGGEEVPGQPLPPVTIKGGSGTLPLAQNLADGEPFIQVEIHSIKDMVVQDSGGLPPFGTEVLITTDRDTYDGYTLSISDMEIKGELDAGFEISFLTN